MKNITTIKANVQNNIDKNDLICTYVSLDLIPDLFSYRFYICVSKNFNSSNPLDFTVEDIKNYFQSKTIKLYDSSIFEFKFLSCREIKGYKNRFNIFLKYIESTPTSISLLHQLRESYYNKSKLANDAEVNTALYEFICATFQLEKIYK